MKLIFKNLLGVMCITLIVCSGCRKQDESYLPKLNQQTPGAVSEKSVHDDKKADTYVPQTWYNLMMKLIVETPGHTPPVAARSFGYTGVALYEALVGDMKNHHSIAGQLNGLHVIPSRTKGNSYFAPITANAALASIIRYLFQNASPTNLASIDALELANEQLYASQISEPIFTRSRNYGHAVADAVYNWSVSDGGYQAYLNNFPPGYIPPAGDGKWIPTPPLYQTAMLPYWGSNRTMLIADESGIVDPPEPPLFSTAPSSPFYSAAYEVYNTSLHLTAEQNTIALFWADGGNTFTPPGHNIAIAMQMIRNLNLNLNDAATLLAKAGIALCDASIVCWRAKYKWNLIRPISYIQLYIEPSWLSSLATPPFPTYTSGHSTFSGAVSAILTSYLGSGLAFSDSTKIGDGFSPRFFHNFTEYAEEAAVSRLYGGIHYSFDNANGLTCGQLIADNVLGLRW